jgi:hypothetical protein
MPEDRLENALKAMRSEDPSREQLEGAHGRVWGKLTDSVPGACLEFRQDFRAYLEGGLAANRRMLLEDHIGRCAPCRTQLAELRGGRNVIAMPRRRASRWPWWGTWAAAAAVVVMAVYAGRDRIDALLAPGGPRATVASVTGSLCRVPAGILQVGTGIGEGEVIRTGPGSHARLRLADGSMIEANEGTEMYVSAAWSGQSVHLRRGDIIVQAAKQRRGHLRVLTRDSVASVKGTVFAVSAGLSGTLVSVVEGAVAVSQPGVDVVLKPGEQASSHPGLQESVQEAIAWSPDAGTYLAELAALAAVEKQIAQLPPPALRKQSRLLPLLPANAMVYVALPNLGETIDQAMAIFEKQSAGSPVLQQWWNGADALKMKDLIGRVQAVTPLLGNEIIFVFSTTDPGTKQGFPMIAAEIQPGKRAELASALEGLRSQEGGFVLPYSLTDTLAVISDSQANLQWIATHLGQGAGTPFAAALASRYENGAGWLIALNMEAALPSTGNAAPATFTGASQMRFLMFERRGVLGGEENAVTLTFQGERQGMASWLANSGSGGAAEYLSSDAVFAAYLSTREPKQLFEELTAQLAKVDPAFRDNMAAAEAKLGLRFSDDLAAACGTESAFAVDGLSLTGPVWVTAILVNNPATLDNAIRRLVELGNAEISSADPSKQITLAQESADGRAWMTLKSAASPLSVTWTYDNGYLVAASDRGTALRAIATRWGGSQLIWSPAFQRQLPESAGMHPAAFAWLNTKGALQGLASMVSSPALQQLMNERDPILVAFCGTSEQIRVASRTQISGLIIDLMLLENLGRAAGGPFGSMLR